jgi:hypothetical protein
MWHVITLQATSSRRSNLFPKLQNAMTFLVRLVLGLSFLVLTEAAAVTCGDAPCVLPQVASCAQFMVEHTFRGNCCALKDDDSNSGGCIVTISDGECYWEQLCARCDLCIAKGKGPLPQ